MPSFIEANITISGLDQVLAKLGEIDPALKNLTPQMQEAGEYLMKFFMEDVYASQGGVIGESWRELSEPYATQKEKKWGDAPLLIASGQMRDSYTLETAADMFKITNVAQTDRGDYYAVYHQEGTSKMPRRMLVKLQPEQLAHITGIIVGRLQSLLNS